MSEKITLADIQSYPVDHPKLVQWLKTTTGKTTQLYIWALIKFDQLSPIKIDTLLEQTDNSPKSKIERRTLIFNAIQSLSNPRQIQINSAIRSLLSYYAIDIADNRGTIRRIETQYYDGLHTRTSSRRHRISRQRCRETLRSHMLRKWTQRRNRVLRLRWHYIEKDFNNRTGPIWLELGPEFRQTNKHHGYGFIGTRARNLITKLVESNEIHAQPGVPLFPYTHNSIVKIISRAKQKARIGDNVHPIHGFRKFYENALISAKLPERIIDIMFGRFKSQDAKAYTQRRREELLPYYEQAYPFLDYMNNIPEQTQAISSELTELRDQNKHLNERLRLTEEKLNFTRHQITTWQAENYRTL